jgi:hypothetical protein
MIYPNSYKTEIIPTDNKIVNSIKTGTDYTVLETANIS